MYNSLKMVSKLGGTEFSYGSIFVCGGARLCCAQLGVPAIFAKYSLMKKKIFIYFFSDIVNSFFNQTAMIMITILPIAGVLHIKLEF